MCVLVSAGPGGRLELSRNDFVPESDSEDDAEPVVDQSVGRSLIEETQAFDDEDVGDGDGGVLSNSTLTADVTPQQVISHNPTVFLKTCIL